MDALSALAPLIRKAEITPEPFDYEKDGLIYCGKCGTPRQTKIKISGVDVIVGCNCACRSEEFERSEEERRTKERMLRIETMRTSGIADKAMRGVSFDKAKNTPEIERAKKYVAFWEKVYSSGTGLLFWGNTGVGKTFTAACIANALIDEGVPVMMTSFPRILNSGFDKSEIVDNLRRYPLLVIDDLGVERNSEYAMETVYYIVDERYKSGMPLICTTNLSIDELRNPKDVTHKRIYERVLEMCTPVLFSGESKRKGRMKSKMDVIREIFCDKGGKQ